ncbi:hypothetical protein Cni_G00863 [Canna indica]|uniref:Uncharacterized protein n=1 Tax=Canna indica TaxID=4628 RepID=A0AAQ3JM82_9LILI|nr:hypothetical protein Cni_G00863 [Canna indica]
MHAYIHHSYIERPKHGFKSFCSLQQAKTMQEKQFTGRSKDSSSSKALFILTGDVSEWVSRSLRQSPLAIIVEEHTLQVQELSKKTSYKRVLFGKRVCNKNLCF